MGDTSGPQVGGECGVLRQDIVDTMCVWNSLMIVDT